jgi:hypothetical protein
MSTMKQIQYQTATEQEVVQALLDAVELSRDNPRVWSPMLLAFLECLEGLCMSGFSSTVAELRNWAETQSPDAAYSVLNVARNYMKVVKNHSGRHADLETMSWRRANSHTNLMRIGDALAQHREMHFKSEFSVWETCKLPIVCALYRMARAAWGEVSYRRTVTPTYRLWFLKIEPDGSYVEPEEPSDYEEDFAMSQFVAELKLAVKHIIEAWDRYVEIAYDQSEAALWFDEPDSAMLWANQGQERVAVREKHLQTLASALSRLL